MVLFLRRFLPGITLSRRADLIDCPAFTPGTTLVKPEIVTERERGGILSGGFVLSFAARLQVLASAEQSADAGGGDGASLPKTLRSMAGFVEEVLYFLSFLNCTKGLDLSRVSAGSGPLR